jgi:hypothetical protein
LLGAFHRGVKRLQVDGDILFLHLPQRLPSVKQSLATCCISENRSGVPAV